MRKTDSKRRIKRHCTIDFGLWTTDFGLWTRTPQPTRGQTRHLGSVVRIDPQYAKGGGLKEEVTTLSRSRQIGRVSRFFWRAAYVVVY
jgi:hypothetical protein